MSSTFVSRDINDQQVEMLLYGPPQHGEETCSEAQLYGEPQHETDEPYYDRLTAQQYVF
ncbi:hypothetical protein [Natronocalculus amylovorans]|uniref:Uncharacterized protein n=1 Tax=Natronocalculus amylovorans TaxID=2917812 RepID=A0AAE3FVL0_9EURY|nr:hypothetical protein [Natronocalculus amylovorans]MCL9816031.1 hypothetical protein [Natronocalculus amylovorans]NUE01452.1 hypothetical protein [Halorubraceae archaeon YAN]